MSRLWDLALHAQAIDPQELHEAILAETGTDFRTRLLLRESSVVLEQKFGISTPEVSVGPTEEAGFPSLWNRVVAMT